MITAAEVESALDQLNDTKRSPLSNIGVFITSLVLFAAAGLISRTWESLAMLIVVLFVHEAGHWVSMKAFGYQDLRIFFIPFFGAAVSGNASKVSATRKAAVVLLGPMTGLLLGLAGIMVYAASKQPLWKEFAIMSVAINGYNLLPIFPLDGGRFLEIVLFSRHPTFQLGFIVVTALALIGLAYAVSSIPLGILALLAFLLARETYYQNKALSSLRKYAAGAPLVLTERIPHDVVEYILPDLSAGFKPESITAKILAGRASAVWEKFIEQPPRLLITVSLLAVYIGTIALVLFTAAAYFAANRNTVIEQRITATNTAIQVEVTYSGKNKIREAQLNASGFYDGPMTAWTVRGIKSAEGSYLNGYRQGEWLNYDRSGALIFVDYFEDGRLVRYETVRDGVRTEIPREDWPFSEKSKNQNSPKQAQLPK